MIRIRHILIAILLLISISPLSASWELSLGGSLNLGIPRTSTPWPNTYYSAAPGIGVSFEASYFPLPWLSVSTGLRYTGKGFIYNHFSQNIPTDILIVTDSFLELPIMLRFSITRMTQRYSLGIGGFIDYRLGRHAVGYMDNVSVSGDGWSSRSDVVWFQGIALKAEDSRFEGGLSFEAAIDTLRANGDAIRYALRYDLSMTSLYRNGFEADMDHHYADAVTFEISYVFAIGKDGER